MGTNLNKYFAGELTSEEKEVVLPLTFWVLSPSDILQYLLKYPNVLRFLYILTLAKTIWIYESDRE